MVDVQRGPESPSTLLAEAARHLVADWPPLSEEQSAAVRAAARTAITSGAKSA